MVISDTGPLLAFAKTDLLSVLERLFTRVHMPQAVHDECHGRQGRDTARIDHAVEQGWLAVLPTRSAEPPGSERRRLPATLARNLGSGEVAAIEWALDSELPLLLLDDRIARRAALQLGLNYLGTARVLWLAEQRAVIDSADAAVERMAACAYRISPRILSELKKE